MISETIRQGTFRLPSKAILRLEARITVVLIFVLAAAQNIFPQQKQNGLNANPNGIVVWQAAITEANCAVTGTETKLQEVMHYVYENDHVTIDKMVKDRELVFLPAGIKVFVEGPIGQFGEVPIRFPGENRIYWTLAGFLRPTK